MVSASRWLGILIATLWMGFAAPDPGSAQDLVEAGDTALSLVLDPMPAPPVEGEMILATIRGSYFYRLNITLDEFTQPEFEGISWVQLSRDKWSRRMIDGRQMVVFERRLALFPQRSGRIEIGPARHLLTLATAQGGRVQHEVASPPVSIEVLAKPAAAAWWLPARYVAVTDEWDRPPDNLGNGEIARRTVTLEVTGLPAQMLPPIPRLRSTGVVAFHDPEERATRLTPDGPVSHVTWRWTVRPASSAPANLEALVIPWFDTRARETREIVVSAQRVAFAAARSPAAAPVSFGQRLAASAGPIGILAGIACGLTLLLAGLRLKIRPALLMLCKRARPHPAIAALRRAVRRNDAMSVRNAARQLVEAAAQQKHHASELLSRELAEFDRRLFSAGNRQTGPEMKSFQRVFLDMVRGVHGSFR